MRVGRCLALALLVAPSLSLASTDPDRAPPVVRMSSPARPSPARFVVLRVGDAGSGLGGVSLHVNGTGVDVGDVDATGRLAFRALAGWEPHRLYRIRMSATDRAGNVRRFTRSIRARNFGIVTVAVRDLARVRVAGVHAAGGCGYVHLRPRRFGPGTAPLALGDSVMLGAAWRLT